MMKAPNKTKRQAGSKPTKETQRTLAERYWTTLDSLLEGCQVIDFDWRYIYLNDVAIRHSRRTREELLGHTMMEIYPGIENTEMFAYLRGCMEKRIPHRMENLFTFPDGSQGWFELSIEPVSEGVFVLSSDITERKKMGEILRKSEEKYRNLIENLPVGIATVAAEGRLIEVNKARQEMAGYDSKEELLKSSLSERYYDPKDRERWLSILQEKGKVEGFEARFKRKDGTLYWASFTAIPQQTESGEMQFLTVMQDITERKQAEEQIKQSAREWQTTFDSISDWVSIHDKDFKIIRVNKAFADFLKMKPEEIIGRHCYELIHGEKEVSQYCSHKEALKTGKPTYKEFFNPHLGIYMEVVCSPIFDERGEITTTVHIGRDITERKSMEEQLILTDRLASIGELASGIAHELNNPLTSVIGFSELLLDRDVPDDVKEDLQTINREAQRTAGVVRNLLTFARKHAPAKQPVDIKDIIQTVLALRAYEQRINNIQVNTRFAPDLPQIIADGFQLQQVFMNIIINAEHFMVEAHGRGALTITTERAGNIIRVSFADDGPGIPQGNLGHIFDPFFTTKEVGKGTGLGLSICHGIITEHGGRIYAQSELGKGATFIMELPIKE